MTASKNTYERIAKAVREGVDSAHSMDGYLALERVSKLVADVFSEDNERFDRSKFLLACGIQEADLEDKVVESGVSITLMTGKKYLFQYQIFGVHRKPRHGTATLIAVTPRPGRSDMLIFSGRPEFGTTEIDSAHISTIAPVADDADCFMDRMVRD